VSVRNKPTAWILVPFLLTLLVGLVVGFVAGEVLMGRDVVQENNNRLEALEETVENLAQQLELTQETADAAWETAEDLQYQLDIAETDGLEEAP